MAQVVEHLPGKHKVQNSNPHNAKKKKDMEVGALTVSGYMTNDDTTLTKAVWHWNKQTDQWAV
jgi:hypothetical protein